MQELFELKQNYIHYTTLMW